MSLRGVVGALPEVGVHAACAGVVGLVLLAVGQPIFTDDLWWHLAMGAEYAASGPWLANDPFLFAAERPAEPAAWLADVGLHLAHAVGGFQGLRVLHVIVVAATLALGWAMLRRVSGSRIAASLGTAAFAALAAYRFFQLRPHLFTMLAALVVVRLLVVDRRPPGPARIGAAALVVTVWANAHGAFVLGIALVGAAWAGATLHWIIMRGERRRSGPQADVDGLRARAQRLAVALSVCVVAACVNPAGPRFLLLYFTAGGDTPDLGVVADEWAPVRLFAAPLLNVPPTPLALAIVWLLLIAMPLLAWLHWRWHWRGYGHGHVARSEAARESDPGARLDPALFVIAAMSLVGLLTAVRLLWMGFFVLLALAQAVPVMRAARAIRGPAWVGRVVALAAALGLVPAFLELGDWSMISSGLHPRTYASPYSTSKYHAHGVWFMRDVGLEGRVFNDYWVGNFLGYWVAPRLQMFVNGSLNVPRSVMQAARDVRARRTDGEGRTPQDLLDAYGVDVFFGTGVPTTAPPGRPHPDTTRHLDDAPGWIPIFRNVQTKVHLRVGDGSNAENLERVRAFYAEQGVPFDPVEGFDPARVIDESTDWAIAHGLVPVDFRRLQAIARAGRRDERRAARERLASIDLLLGLYDRAAARDERLLDEDPDSIFTARRRAWSLLHAGRWNEARIVADQLEQIAPSADGLSRVIVDAARQAANATPAERASILGRLPVFTRPQGQWAALNILPAEPRAGRN